jgi:hypothetical protein
MTGHFHDGRCQKEAMSIILKYILKETFSMMFYGHAEISTIMWQHNSQTTFQAAFVESGFV